MYLQFPKEFKIVSMMHVIEKIVHVKIEKLIKTTCKTICRCGIAVRFILVGQRLLNRHI